MTHHPDVEKLLPFFRDHGPPKDGELPDVRAGFDKMIEFFKPAPDDKVTEGTLGGVRVTRVQGPGANARKVLLFFHGGGYLVGSSKAFAGFAGALARSFGGRAIAVDYRLAPENKFPTAVDDCVAAYRGLVAEGVRPEQIALAGDSAGGALSVAVLLSLRDAKQPLPSCAVLISPWTDHEMQSKSHSTNAERDPDVTKQMLDAFTGAYLQGQSPRSPLVAPLHADLRGLPPLLIQVGSAEILLDDSLRLASVAAHANVSVTLQVWPDMIHDWPVFSHTVSDGPRAIAAAGAFIAANIGKR